jgi:integrase/recombinase XerD
MVVLPLFWDQVDKAALQAFAATRREAGSGTATINRYLSVVSGIADHVRELPGWPEVNPVKLLPSKPRRERRVPYIRPPAGDIEAIFARTRRPFQDFCRLALLCGARLDELAQLKRADATGGRASFWDTKNRTVRTIGWTEEARGIVERQPVTTSPFLFTTRDGEPYTSVTGLWREARGRAQKAAQAAGGSITELRFHDLRHEYAIRYLENGGSIFVLQQLLGHGSIRQTEGYLRYLTPEQAARSKQGAAQIAAH